MITVRAERAEDLAAIREVNELAFGRPEEARLVELLRSSPDFVPALSLVALDEDGRVAGHALFSLASIDSPGGPARALALGPIAVRPERQRQGVGGALMRRGLEEARRLGFPLVVLVGHPEYYPRFGFVPAGAKGFSTKFPAPAEAFLVCELQERALARLHGAVHFSSCFDQVEAGPPPSAQRPPAEV